MTVKARSIKDAPLGKQARELGEALGWFIVRERRRNRRHFTALWLALVALTLYVVLT